MPNQTVTFKRWHVVTAFVVLTVAFVTMGFFQDQNWKHTNHAVALIQRSRLDSCKITYQGFRDLINLSVADLRKAQHGKIFPKQQTRIDKYLIRFQEKKCVKLILPPAPAPKTKTTKEKG